MTIQSPAISQLVEKGLTHHKSGDFSSARSSYEQVISAEPENVDALHLLGMLNMAEGDISAAIHLLLAAIAINPCIAIFHNNLGNIYFNKGDLHLAEKYFGSALSVSPNYLEAKFNLANTYFEQHDVAKAESIYKQILLSNPDFIPALNNLLEILVDKSDYASAYAILKNNNTDKSNSELNEKRIAMMALYSEQTQDEGIKEELLRQIIQAEPNNTDALYNLANVYKSQSEFVKAETFYLKVLQLDGVYFGALVNFGVIDTWLGRFESALVKFNQAYMINNDDYMLLNNLGLAYQAVSDCEKSTFYYEKAIAIDGKKPEAYWNYSLLLLLNGEYGKGWQYYEYRWEVPEQLQEVKREYVQPVWKGEALLGKVLFVYCEQGYGDSLQFVRYLRILLDANNEIVLECPKSLHRIFQKIDSRLVLIKTDDKPPFFDYHIAMMSLPLAFNTRLSSIPDNVPYLKTSLPDIKYWKNVLDEFVTEKTNVKKVGVVWAGNPRRQNSVNQLVDKRRSCQLENFSTLFDVDGFGFFSLQKDSIETGEYVSLNDCMENVTDFYDTACLIQNLDLVISVDTAVAHLAAALGKPVWLLSRYDGCWRWLIGREDSPWYPTLRLFRQESSGDWDGVFEKVKDALQVLSKDTP